MPAQLLSKPSGTNTRTRASLACQACRQRKIKCDAQRRRPGQACTTCTQANLECVLDANSDRRKAGSRKQIESLKERIDTLEAVLRQTREHRSPERVPRDSPLGDLLPDAVQRSREDRLVSETTTTPRASIDHAHNDNGQNFAKQSYELSTHQLSPVETTGGIEAVQCRGLGQEEDRDSPRSQNERYILNRRSSREESQPYYGPTSQPHVWSPSDSASGLMTEHQDAPANEPSNLGIDVDMRSVHLRNHLLHSYFKYQSLWLNVVQEDVFMAARAAEVQSQWYSSFLEAVLLACAARLSTSNAVRALSHEYAKQAKLEMIVALEHPSPASLQGFIMLSEYEVTMGHDRIGWMLCGLACRMMPDIGLHHRMRLLDNPAEKNSTALTEAKKFLLLLCACISYEGIWCLYLGRPSSIQKTVVDATLEQCNKCSLPEATMATIWVGFCVLMAEVNELLNGPDVLSSSVQYRLTELDASLCLWHDRLPSGVAFDYYNIANLDSTAYGLHMQFCKVRILIYERKLLADQSVTGSISTGNDLNSSSQIIHEHALRIAKLLYTYRQLFGLEKVPSIMLDNALVSATALIKHSLAEQQHNSDTTCRTINHEEERFWLRSTVDTFQAVKGHFPITQRMIASLEQLALDSPLQDVFAEGQSPNFHSRTTAVENIASAPANLNRDVLTAQTNPQIDLASLGGVEDDYTRLNTTARVRDRQFPFHQEHSLFDLHQQWPEDETTELVASVLSWPGAQFMASMLAPAI